MIIRVTRREFVKAAVALCSSTALSAAERSKTEFQIACMTLPYSQFPLQRALTGIRDAGFRYVAWGTTHREENGKQVPIMAPSDAPEKAKEIGKRCRDLGLEPLMMFSVVYPEHKDAPEVFPARIRQAAAAGIPQVLTFGHTEKGHRELWIRRFREWGPIAADHGVMLVIKQHGGETGTGKACAEIVKEIAHPAVKVNYDAGNVMDYLDVDPISDFRACVSEVRSLCIKDHRNFPKDEDCGPGYGEIDHFKLLHPIAFGELKIPLCCENIFAPLRPKPTGAEEIDRLARRAREYLEVVIQGLQSGS